jgi:hypothetical protein
MFYNGAFSIASKNDLDDQNLLLATVPNRTKTFFYRFFIYKINNNKSGKAKSVGKFLACFSFFKIFDGAWPINTIHTV